MGDPLQELRAPFYCFFAVISWLRLALPDPLELMNVLG